MDKAALLQVKPVFLVCFLFFYKPYVCIKYNILTFFFSRKYVCKHTVLITDAGGPINSWSERVRVVSCGDAPGLPEGKLSENEIEVMRQT